MNRKRLHQDIYAVIDLGSNSFHMKMVKIVAGSVQVISRVKRKVRLASGLDAHNQLSQVAMERGWECLSLFSEQLQDIPSENIVIVGTATLRLAENVSVFLKKAESILKHPIQIITGEDEAKTIYLGVAHTSSSADNRIVVDIGGASTEVIVGYKFEPLALQSLDIGCVTFLEKFFPDHKLTEQAFSEATQAAREVLSPYVDEFVDAGWSSAVGASGSVQALQEILIAQGFDEVITLERLHLIKEQAIACGHIDRLNIQGLSEERKLVFASGLAILIAIFERLNIQGMTLSGGALREGLLYSMLPKLQQRNIRERTLSSLLIRYHLDKHQAKRVSNLACQLAYQVNAQWALSDFDGIDVLSASAQLHELGLLIHYKKHQHHAAYILENTDMPGFTRAQHKLLIALVHNHRQDIAREIVDRQTMTSPLLAGRLTRILRLAVLLSLRRQDEVLPKAKLSVIDDELTVSIDPDWLEQHPLTKAELEQEIQYQKNCGWLLRMDASCHTPRKHLTQSSS